jgi:hypothetical protein
VTVLEQGLLEDGRRYAVVEELGTFCPLGLRFWDAVGDAQIRGGLLVRAWPLPARRPVVTAFRTVSDVYAFQGLPGLVDVERPAATPFVPASPPVTRPFIVEVRDLERQFLPVAFGVDLPLPHRGLFQPSLASSPSGALPGFYLFSSPVRMFAPGVAVVRAELVDSLTGRRAPWALVRVSVAGQGDRWGMADAAGRVGVAFPIPLLAPGFGQLFGSPSTGSSPPGPPVGDRSWTVSVSVFWEPSRLSPLPGTDLPDLVQVFQQAPVSVLASNASPPVPTPEWVGTLPWDGELVAATAGLRQLWIDRQGSP